MAGDAVLIEESPLGGGGTRRRTLRCGSRPRGGGRGLGEYPKGGHPDRTHDHDGFKACFRQDAPRVTPSATESQIHRGRPSPAWCAGSGRPWRCRDAGRGRWPHGPSATATGGPGLTLTQARTYATPDEVCSPLAVRRADPRPAWTHAGSDTCWPRAGHRNRARQSDDDADAKAGQARPGSWSTRWRASPALHRVSTGRIPASPGLSLGSVPTGLMLIVEIVLVGPRATSPPKPCPHRLDSAQHGRSPSHAHCPPCQTQQQEQHRIVISRGTAGPHRGHIPPERQGQHRSPAGGQRPSSAALFSQHRRSSRPPRFSLARRKPGVQIPSPPPSF